MKKTMAHRAREVLGPIAKTHGLSLDSLMEMVESEAKRRAQMGEDLEATHIALLERMRVRFDAAVTHYPSHQASYGDAPIVHRYTRKRDEHEKPQLLN